MSTVSFEQTREALSSHPGGGGYEPEVPHLGRDGLRVRQPHAKFIKCCRFHSISRSNLFLVQINCAQF